MRRPCRASTVTDIALHGYWRSSASYRVRIALNLKGISYRQIAHDLRTGAHRDPAYTAIAPHGLVPALEVDGQTLIQSPAIIEWIEARWPSPALLPADLDAAAIVRSMAAIIGCDIHPLNNLRILNVLKASGTDQDGVNAWVARWVAEGLAALEHMVARHGGGFCYGQAPTIADCYLVPQIYNARRFGVDLTPYPTLLAADEAAHTLPAFVDASPEAQPDADR